MGIDSKVNYERVITIRPAVNDDIYYGLLDCFSSFGQTISHELAEIQFLNRQKTVKTFVACEDNKNVIGTISVMVKHGFTHNGRPAATIEDVITKSHYRHLGIGAMLVNHAVSYCRQLNCYKVILDCNEGLESFYNQFGFHKDGYEMRINL